MIILPLKTDPRLYKIIILTDIRENNRFFERVAFLPTTVHGVDYEYRILFFSLQVPSGPTNSSPHSPLLKH